MHRLLELAGHMDLVTLSILKNGNITIYGYRGDRMVFTWSGVPDQLDNIIIYTDRSVTDLHNAGLCYMGSEPGDPVPPMWPLAPQDWNPTDHLTKAAEFFNLAAVKCSTDRQATIYRRLAQYCKELTK